jgi:hypothetical protein
LAEAIVALPVEGGPRASSSFSAATRPAVSKDRTMVLVLALLSAGLLVALAVVLLG